jgi:hypothetical protein
MLRRVSSESYPAVPKETKDWTWVLGRPCPECGFDASTARREDVAGLLRANAMAWPEVLADPRARARPSPQVWSAVEYACHVRDVLRLYDYRLSLMLSEDDPLFPNWDQDATAVTDRYGEQDPSRVAAELAEAAERLAAAFDGVSGAQWERQGRRSDGVGFIVDTFARYMVHDPIHHVHDVRAGYAALGG